MWKEGPKMNQTEIYKGFADALESVRHELNMTQEQFAKALKITTSTYKRIQSLETTKIDLYTLHLLYRLTGKTINEISGDRSKAVSIIRNLPKLTNEQLDHILFFIDMCIGTNK